MTTHSGSAHSWNTRAVHAGKDDLAALGLHAPPIDLSTTYPSHDVVAEAARLDDFAAGNDDGGPPVYGRVTNPTVRRFENALAELEGAEAAVAFASGMAALSACLRPLYGTTDHLLDSGLLGNSVTWVSPEEAASAITGRTGLVIVESPANPTLTEVDLRALTDACAPVPVLVDNTFATPVLQRPLALGATMVLHSATKYLGGHGDVMGGVIACDEEFARSLRQIRFVTGGMLHPIAGYELLRGLATLPVRVRAASATAAELARRLAEHPRVTQVYYPRLGGAMVSFETSADPIALVSAVRLITPAVSLGSVDSLIQHPASLTHRIMDEVARKDAGISPDLVRLSVGLEDVEDLWTDLTQALAQAVR